MMICPTCGNKVERSASTCKFCGEDLQQKSDETKSAYQLHRIVNLEHGRPTVANAMRKLEQGISQACQQRVKVLTLIHGYGSSGKGGLIKEECRKMLAFYQQKGTIKSAIAGEAFKRKSGPGKGLLRQYPTLERLCTSDFNNPGVSIVVL